MKRREFLALTGGTLAAATLAPVPRQAGAQNREAMFLLYSPREGWLDNWLVAGPQNTPVAAGEYKFNAALRPPLVRQNFKDEPLFDGAPLENAPLENAPLENAPLEGAPLAPTLGPTDALFWRAYACEDDHLIDLSAWHPKSDYVRAWAFCTLHLPAARQVPLRLFANGPVVAFLNGQRLLRSEAFDYFAIARTDARANLQAGDNTFLVRFDQLMTRNGPHTLAVQLEGAPDITVKLPTPTRDPERRLSLERAFDRAYLSRDSFGEEQKIQLLVPDLPAALGRVSVELMAGPKVVRSATWDTAQKPKRVELGVPGALDEGSYAVRLRGGDVARELRLDVVKDAYSPAPYGTFEQRRREVLEYALQHAEGLRPTLALMSLGRWKEVDRSGIDRALEMVRA